MCFIALHTLACDVCGGSGNTQLSGILPIYTGHIIGVQGQYRYFTATQKALSEQNPDSYFDEHYHTMQVWGKFQAGSKTQLYAFVPFQSNVTITNGLRTVNSGLGDVSFLANRVVLKTPDTLSGAKHMLMAGIGAKLPTGKYSGLTERSASGLPNMQPGTGTWDFSINANYTIRGAKYGLYTEASYVFTTPDKEWYKYGNRLGTSAAAFAIIRQNALTVLPQAGARYEFSLHDYDNYQRKWLDEQTGGSMLFGTLGVQATWKRVGAQLNAYLPLWQNYAAGNVTAKYRTDAGIFILL